jgi:plasmid stabilization system protein ParE
VRHLRFDEEAEAEFLEAADSYDADNRVVAWRFVQAVLSAIESVHGAPHEWPLSPDVPKQLDVHRLRAVGFRTRSSTRSTTPRCASSPSPTESASPDIGENDSSGDAIG